jgi:hypothetical protein
MKVLIIIIDRGAINQNGQFNLLTYNYFNPNTANMFAPTVVNLLITPIYSNNNDFRNKCIIGFTDLLPMNGVSPYFKYDIGTNGIVNGSHNSPGFKSIKALCFTNL